MTHRKADLSGYYFLWFWADWQKYMDVYANVVPAASPTNQSTASRFLSQFAAICQSMIKRSGK